MWKGEPLSREVRGLQVHPNVNRPCGRGLNRGRPGPLKKVMLDIVYIGLVMLFFAAFTLYARGCEKL